MSTTDRPLVTFALLAYNQERFVAEAIRGAFSQTYAPLEIILSDDQSSDRTFEIMQEEAARYDGPHSVVLNRSTSNLGLCGHLNQVMKLVRGGFVVGAAGDDVSLPDRAVVATDEWIARGCGEISIFSSYEVIGEQGEWLRSVVYPRGIQIGDMDRRIEQNALACGVTHCWSKALFERFGELIPGAVNEDGIIQFRAALRGGVIILPQVLALYRWHSMNISKIDSHTSRVIAPDRDASSFVNTSLRYHERFLTCLESFERDLSTESSLVPSRAAELAVLIEKARRMADLWRIRIDFFKGGWAMRFRCLSRIIAGRHGSVEVGRMAMLMISPRFYEVVKQLGAKIFARLPRNATSGA